MTPAQIETSPTYPAALAAYMVGRRWFAGKGREFTVAHVDALPWLAERPRLRIEVVTVQYEDGTRDSYQLPVAYLDDLEPDHDHALIGHVTDPTGDTATVVAYDAVYLKDCAEVLLAAFHAGLSEATASRVRRRSTSSRVPRSRRPRHRPGDDGRAVQHLDRVRRGGDPQALPPDQCRLQPGHRDPRGAVAQG